MGYWNRQIESHAEGAIGVDRVSWSLSRGAGSLQQPEPGRVATEGSDRRGDSSPEACGSRNERASNTVDAVGKAPLWQKAVRLMIFSLYEVAPTDQGRKQKPESPFILVAA